MTELFDTTDQKAQEKEIEVVKKEDGSYVVGDKYYADEAAFMKSRVAADKHINTIEKENRDKDKLIEEYKKQLEQKKETLESSLAERLEQQTQDKTIDDLLEGDNPPMAPQVDVDKLRQEMSDDLYNKVTQDTDRKLRIAEQKGKLKDSLIQTYGSKEKAQAAAEKYFESDLYDQDMYSKFLMEKPSALVKLINSIEPPPSSQRTSFGATPGIPSTLNSAKNSSAKKYSHYKEMKAKHPRQWGKPEVQQQYRADFNTLGKEAFFDVDF